MASDSSTEIIDGVAVQFKTGIDEYGPTRTVVVPLITPARQDQNGNDTADIPLRTLPGGAPALMAHLPVGYGLRMESLQDTQPASSAVELLTAQIEAYVPAAGQSSMIDRMMVQGRWQFETRPFELSAIAPTVAPGGAAAPLTLAGALSNILLIDTNGQGDAVHVDLGSFRNVLITGAGTFNQVPGWANIVADDANQSIVIDGSSDRISTGGGDDRIIVG